MVYCAQEHTWTNMQSAHLIVTDNGIMQKRDDQTMERRQLDLPAVPSLNSDEMATNPFLRAVKSVGMPQPPKHSGTYEIFVTNSNSVPNP